MAAIGYYSGSLTGGLESDYLPQLGWLCRDMAVRV